MDITSDVGMIRSDTRDLHAIEALDYDMDGDDDLLICHDAAPRELHLVENTIGQDNNWLGVQLYAPYGVNGSSIGARIYVWSGGVQRMREVYGGRGNNGGQQPFKLLFGLGSNRIVDSVKVVWPDAAGTVTVVKNPPVNEYAGITKNGLSVSTETHEPDAGLKLYPNPAVDFVLVQMNNNMPVVQITVYDIWGRVVDTLTGSGSDAISYYMVKHLPSGRYFIQTTTRDGKVYSGQFMRQ